MDVGIKGHSDAGVPGEGHNFLRRGIARAVCRNNAAGLGDSCLLRAKGVGNPGTALGGRRF